MLEQKSSKRNLLVFAVIGSLLLLIAISEASGWVYRAEAARLENCIAKLAGYDPVRGLHWNVRTTQRHHWQPISSCYGSVKKQSALLEKQPYALDSLVALEQRFALLQGGLVRAEAQAMRDALSSSRWFRIPPIMKSEFARETSYLPERGQQSPALFSSIFGSHLPVVDRNGELLAFDELLWTFTIGQDRLHRLPQVQSDREVLPVIAAEETSRQQMSETHELVANLYSPRGDQRPRSLMSGTLGLNAIDLPSRLSGVKAGEWELHGDYLFAESRGDPGVGRLRRWTTGECALPILGVSHAWRTDEHPSSDSNEKRRLEGVAHAMASRVARPEPVQAAKHPDGWMFRKALRTTLDWRLQCAVYYRLEAMQRAAEAEDFGEDGFLGYALIADITSGEIMALAEYPSADYNFRTSHNPVANVPVSMQIQPSASSFKPFVLAWMLEMANKDSQPASKCSADWRGYAFDTVPVDAAAATKVSNAIEHFVVPESNIGEDGEVLDPEQALKKSNQLAMAQYLLAMVERIDLFRDDSSGQETGVLRDSARAALHDCMHEIFVFAGMEQESLMLNERVSFPDMGAARLEQAERRRLSGQLWQHLRAGWGQGMRVSAFNLVDAWRILALSTGLDASESFSGCGFLDEEADAGWSVSTTHELPHLHFVKRSKDSLSNGKSVRLYAPGAARQVWRWLCYSSASSLGSGTGAAICVGARTWAVKTGTPEDEGAQGLRGYLMVGGVPANAPRFIVLTGIHGVQKTLGDEADDERREALIQHMRRTLWSHAAWETLTRYGDASDASNAAVRSECSDSYM